MWLWLFLIGLTASCLYWLISAVLAVRVIRTVPLLLPVASMILSAMIVSAGYLGWRRGGIIWRGTLYRTQVLCAGARVRFP